MVGCNPTKDRPIMATLDTKTHNPTALGQILGTQGMGLITIDGLMGIY